jgi:hypothetical protein
MTRVSHMFNKHDTFGDRINKISLTQFIGNLCPLGKVLVLEYDNKLMVPI